MGVRFGVLWAIACMVACAVAPSRASGRQCFDDVNFALNRANVVDAPRNLDRVARWLAEESTRQVRLIGSADPTGTPQHNQGLAQRRAEAVRDYLVDSLSVDRGRIIEARAGAVASQAGTRDEHLTWRRVRIEAVGGECGEAAPAPPPEKDPEAETAYQSDVQDRLNELEDPAFMIVLIPDPVDSHLARDYDIYLSAFRDALGSMRYQLDRFEMPWPLFDEDDRRELPAKWSPQEAERLEDHLTRFRRTPGVMVFSDPKLQRGSKNRRRPREIVAYLVGETPTWGIQRKAFDVALREIAARRGSRKPLGILGPTYSGSVSSLVRALNAEGHGLCELRVISGTASRQANESELRGVANYEQLPVSTDRRLEKLIENLQERDPHIGCEDILLLRESSVYGAPGESKLCGGEPKTITYPINISALRAAHEKLGAEPSAELDTDLLYQNSRLPLSLGAPAGPTDRVPLYGANLTPQTLDMIIGDVLRRVDADDTLAIGIIGTSVQDKLFLASEISKHAGDVRLFTDEADILLAHPRFAFATHGMLTIATNRMHEDLGAGRHSFFASDAAHGVFAAARQLLDEGGAALTVSGGEAESAPTCEDAENPTEKEEKKTLWSSIVGRGRIVTVSCCTAPCDAYANLAIGGSAWADSEPPRQRVWVLLVLVNLALAATVVLRAFENWIGRLARAGAAIGAGILLVQLLAPALWASVRLDPSASAPADLGAPVATLLLGLAALVPAVVTITALALETTDLASKAISTRLDSWLQRATGLEWVAVQGFEYAAKALVRAFPYLLAIPYVVIASKLATPIHAQLDSGLSLIPAASMAHVAGTVFCLLFIDRRRLGKLEKLGLGERFRLFGTRRHRWKIFAAVLVLGFPALMSFASPLVRTLEGTVLVDWLIAVAPGPLVRTLEGAPLGDWLIAVVLLGMIVLSVEALWFAYRLTRDDDVVRWLESPDEAAKLRRRSTLAAPACMLLLLLAVETYPFQPRGLLILVLTLVVALEALAAFWLVLRLERKHAASREGAMGLGDLLGALQRESVPAIVLIVSVIGLLPSVRERFGGLVDLFNLLVG